jgi:predicted MPP superfamily phosphohydrolase
MGFLLGFAAELALLGALAAIQWWIIRAAISFTESRLPVRWARTARVLLFGAGAVLLFGLILSLPNTHGLPMNAHLAGWIRGAALLWAFTSAPGWLVYRLLRPTLRRAASAAPGRRALLRTLAGAAAVAPIALIGFGALVERTAFRVREIDIPVPDLHPDLEGLRLVQLSDIHLSPFLSEEEFARVVDAANELRPHLVLVTGDLISVRGDPLDACLRQLSRLRADAGVLGCLGNHEIYSGTERYTTEQGARLGVPFLRHQARPLRFGNALLNVAGVDYQRMNWSPHYLEGAGRLIVPGALNVLLQHNPDVFPTAARQGWDLTLAGHTHGGQVNIEILGRNLNVARFYTPYVYGLYRSGRSSIYVTRGIGTIGMPARLGAPPEIAALRLRKV